MEFTNASGLALSSDSGTYTFSDCKFDYGFTATSGGTTVTRTVSVEHANVLGGLYFEYGGQKNWTIRWSYILGDHQALRPNAIDENGDVTMATTFTVEDSIAEITSTGSATAHCEAMQSLGGNDMHFTRVRFITPGPYVDGTSGQTASINFAGGSSTFDECEFLQANAFYYTVYSRGASIGDVVFTNCRIASGMAGYDYPNNTTTATCTGCTDIDTGAPVTFYTPAHK